MEGFVDRIMETDRKAREMIDAAQREKKQILALAQENARRKLEERAAELERGKRDVDAQLAAQGAAGEEAVNKAYLRAKHALDDAFDAHRDAWLDEITDAILAAR